MSWLNRLLKEEQSAHLSFFGKTFDLSVFESTLEQYGETKVKEWKELLLEPHFLLEVEIARKADFPGFKVRPDNHCYEVVYQGKVLRMKDGKPQTDKKAHWLLGQTVLIDTRLKPAYHDSKQMWANDSFMGPIIQDLREEGKIPKYEYGRPQSSRFGCSDLDWDEHIKPVLAKELNLSFRLERAIEAIVIPQMYIHMPRNQDGSTNTSVWYEEYFGDCSGHLFGGDSDCGGLAGVCWGYAGRCWYDRSFRPLAVL